MGESAKPLSEPSFNCAVKVCSGQDRLTSDAGSLLLREADHLLGLTQSLAAQLYDHYHPERTRYTLVELLRERLYALAQGYDAQDDADELAHDPAMRLATWDQPGKRVQKNGLPASPPSRGCSPHWETTKRTWSDAAKRWLIGRAVTCGPRATTTPRGRSRSTLTAFRFRLTDARRA